VALIVLDASVIIAHLDPEDALHSEAVNQLNSVGGEELVLPASALAETLVVPARRGRLADARAAIDALMIRIEPLTDTIAELAAELRGSHRSVRLPDALVIATGDHLEAGAILTADRKWRRISPRVRLL
jgi:predicted nucleic acid-binding protein